MSQFTVGTKLFHRVYGACEYTQECQELDDMNPLSETTAHVYVQSKGEVREARIGYLSLVNKVHQAPVRIKKQTFEF